MTTKTWSIILSLWVAVLPFLGFPVATKNWLVTISALAIAVLLYLSGRINNPPQA